VHAHEQVNHYLRHIGHALDLDLELDEEGICAVEDQEGMRWIVEVPRLTETLVLLTPLMDVQAEESSWFLRRLLAAHLNLQQLQGAYFAIDDRRGRLLLCISRPVFALNPQMFEDLFLNFIELSVQMTDLVKELHEDYDAYPEGSSVAMSEFFDKA
jgi:hypothetical protein